MAASHGGVPIAGLLLLRAVWGFVGPAHARFGDFVRSPKAVLAYVRQTIRMRAPRYLGHNPAGGVMVLAFMATLAAISVTGFMMTTDAFWGSEWVEDLHKALVYAALVSSRSTSPVSCLPQSSTAKIL